MKKDFKLELHQIIDQLGDNEPVLIAEIQRMLADAQLLATETKGSQPFARLLSNEIQNQMNAEGKAPLIATGFSCFDKKFGGFALGEYIILASRPSVGKTQMLIDFSLHISKEIPLAFFTNSMSELLLRQRFLATIQNLAIENVVLQNLTQEEKQDLSLLDLNSYKMHINKSQGSNTALFFQECKRLVVEDSVKVIVLDDIQHLSNTT